MKKILEIYSKGLFSTLDESLCQEVLVLFGDLGSSNYENNLKYTAEKNNSKYDLIIGPLENTEANNLVSYFISKGYKAVSYTHLRAHET